MGYDDDLARLTAACAADTPPALSTEELGALLTDAARYVVWSAAAPQIQGVIVRPTIPNGHLYRALTGGSTGATEPTWPLYTAPDRRPGLTEPYWFGWTGPAPSSQVQDGDVLWQECGPDPGDQYDLRAAERNAWLAKAAKAASMYDLSVDSNSYSKSQIIEHCLAMARTLTPMSIA